MSKVMKRRTGLKKGVKQWIEVFPFIGLGMALFIVFTLWPQIKNIYISFTNYSIMPGAKQSFVGFDNYKHMLFDNLSKSTSDASKFWTAFRNNILAIIVTVPLQMILGLITALAIHKLNRGKQLYKVFFYIAVICDWVVVVNIFLYIFKSDPGSLANYVLNSLGILSDPIVWMNQTWTANAVIWLLCIWKGFGWVMVIYLAALAGVPKDQYEAAMIDGAAGISQLRYITLPAIKGTSFYLIINLINGAMNIFIQVFLMTGGKPLGTTDVLMNLIYNKAFTHYEFGYAAAAGIVMGLCVFTMSMFFKKYLRYEQE